MPVYSDIRVSPEHEARMSRFAAFMVGLLMISCMTMPPLVFGAGGPPPLRADDFIIIAIFFMARRQNAQLGRRAFSPVLTVGMCLWLVYVFAEIVGSMLTLSQRPWLFVINDLYTPLMYCRTMLIFISVGSLHIQARHLWKLVGLLALMGAAETLLGMSEVLFPNAFTGFVFSVYHSKTFTPEREGGSFARAFGTLANPNNYGGVLALLAGFAMAIGLFAKRGLFRIFGLGVTAFMFYTGVILAQSRTALFTMALVVVTSITFSLFLPRGRWMPVLVLIGLVLLGTVGLGLLQSIELPPRVQDLFNSVKSHGVATGVSQSTGRLDIWKSQLSLLETSGNYWFGIGSSKVSQEDFDDGFLGAVMTGGLLGLMSFCGIYIFMFYTAVTTLLKGRHGAYAPSALALVCAPLTMVTFEVTAGYANVPSLSVLLGSAMGLIAMTRREVNDEWAARNEAESYAQDGRAGQWPEETPLQETSE